MITPDPDYTNWSLIPQAPSTYEVHRTCQVENLGKIYEHVFGLCDPKFKGAFVDVGAFDGKVYSNTWGLAGAGWRGLMVEPMPENVEKCRLEHSDHPWVIIEPIACSDKDGVIPMHFEREGSCVIADTQPHQLVRCTTLDALLDTYRWPIGFDVLSVDVEEHELKVFAGFTLAKWIPKLAIIETKDGVRAPTHALFDALYKTIYEDGLNTIFLRK